MREMLGEVRRRADVRWQQTLPLAELLRTPAAAPAPAETVAPQKLPAQAGPSSMDSHGAVEPPEDRQGSGATSAEEGSRPGAAGGPSPGEPRARDAAQPPPAAPPPARRPEAAPPPAAPAARQTPEAGRAAPRRYETPRPVEEEEEDPLAPLLALGGETALVGSASEGFSRALHEGLRELKSTQERERFVVSMLQERTRGCLPEGKPRLRTFERNWPGKLVKDDAEARARAPFEHSGGPMWPAAAGPPAAPRVLAGADLLGRRASGGRGLVRSPSDVLPPSASSTFAASGISDLRAAAVAQQRQLDGLVDKVAAVMSSMHAQMLQDLRAECSAEALQQAVCEADSRLSQLRAGEGSLQAWVEGEARRLGEQLAQGQLEAGEACERAAQEARQGHLDLAEGLREARDEASRGLAGVRGALDEQAAEQAAELRELRERLQRLEGDALRAEEAVPAWQAEAEGCCAALREELRGEIAAASEYGMEAALGRIAALEEQLRAGALCAEARQLRGDDKVEQLRAESRRLAASVDQLVVDCRQLQRTQGREAEAREWRQRADEAAAAAEARLGMLEQRQLGLERGARAAAEEVRRPAAEELAGPRWAEVERRLQMVERSVAVASVPTPLRPRPASPPASAAKSSVEARVEEVAARVDGVALSFGQELRRWAQRLREVQDRAEAADRRAGAAEAAAKAARVVRAEARPADKQGITAAARAQRSHSARHAVKVERALQTLVDNLRSDLEWQVHGSKAELSAELERLRRELWEGLGSRGPQQALAESASTRRGPGALAAEALASGRSASCGSAREAAAQAPASGRSAPRTSAREATAASAGPQQLERRLEELEARLQDRAAACCEASRADVERRLESLGTSFELRLEEHKAACEERLAACEGAGGRSEPCASAREAAAKSAGPSQLDRRLEELEARLQDRAAASCEASRADVERRLESLGTSFELRLEEHKAACEERWAACEGAGASLAQQLQEALSDGHLERLEQATRLAERRSEAAEATRGAMVDLKDGLQECVEGFAERLGAVEEQVQERLDAVEEQVQTVLESSQMSASVTLQDSCAVGAGGGAAAAGLGVSAAETSAASCSADGAEASSLLAVSDLSQRLRFQEAAVDELRKESRQLRGTVEGFLLERKVSRSLEGLERPRRSLSCEQRSCRSSG
ncbi:unnamed protein product [Prorocentrum cordatum]|uniref:Uncharacterized protein n=1 Tax=Prorocentrum cordatum TaxID=2364126 RepID=A0ABN9VE33_9DINO|nr:unnamed protein product [Polarella glacialis]